MALDELINYTPNPANLKDKRININDINDFIQRAEDEKTEIIHKLKFEYINNFTPAEISAKVGFYQRSLIKLSDKIYSYDVNFKINYLYNQIQVTIGEIMDFLFHNFEMDFDLNLKLPKSRHVEAIETLQPLLDNCMAKMKTLKINEHLVEVFNSIAFYFDINDKRRLTFRLINYFAELLQALEDISAGDPNQYEQLAIDVFFNFSFNSAEFIKYYTLKIRGELDQLETRNERIQFIFNLLKKTRQVIIYNPDQILSDRTPSLKKAIELWLSEELEYYKNLKSNLFLFPPELSIKQKIKTTLSVTEFSFFSRKLFDSSFVKGCTFKEFTEQLCNIFMGPDREEYQPVSLRTKFASIRPSGKDHIKTIVINIMNNINSHS